MRCWQMQGCVINMIGTKDSDRTPAFKFMRLCWITSSIQRSP